MRIGNQHQFQDALKSARNILLTDLGVLGPESFYSLCPTLVKLYQLTDVEKVWKFKNEENSFQPSIIKVKTFK